MTVEMEKYQSEFEETEAVLKFEIDSLSGELAEMKKHLNNLKN